MADVARFDLTPVPGRAGLYAAAAAACGLADGVVYHYWLVVDDSRSSAVPPMRIAVTDPFACSVDWRVYPHDADPTAFPHSELTYEQPAAVIKYVGAGELAEADPGGEAAVFAAPDAPGGMPTNNQAVICEVPGAWCSVVRPTSSGRAVATFLDVTALVDENAAGANFSDLVLLQQGQAYLADLGVNVIELLPAADSYFKREWGYDTSHYLAPDAELGFPEGNLSPTANRDLARLVGACHAKNIRSFIDVVMAFAKNEPYNHIDAPNFCMDDPENNQGDPDAWSSRPGVLRDGFGSTLWRYARQVNTYDPVSGEVRDLYPARQLMLTYLTRWIRDFRPDGIRMDSVENVANWDFVQAFRDLGWTGFETRWADAGLPPGAAADRFLVVGEELSLPSGLLTQNRLDALWNDGFQQRVRAAVLGEGLNDNFEWTVKKAIDCRLAGVFTQGTQVVNYVTKHDVEGYRQERLFTMLRKIQDLKPDEMTDDSIKRRIKLAWVCLLTSVGIPMFLAGEEFADQHDLFDPRGNVSQSGGKQIDPVNFDRFTAAASNDKARNPDGYYAPMRREIHDYVRNLIRLRTSSPALWVDDTNFIWMDFGDNKRVLVWRRGTAAEPAPVIVLANFSDFQSAPGADYVVRTWPQPVPVGKKWRDVSQGRDVDPAWVGRETIFPWEAKVYMLVDA